MCDDAMLIVELDGSQHTDPTHATRDAERTEYLEALGYLVVRIWNTDINQNLIGVLDGLWATDNARRKAPSSGLRPPSPQGEKESNLREGS